MAAEKQALAKKYFTVAEANAALPLVRAIVSDITELANDLRKRKERLSQDQPPQGGRIAEVYQEELQAEFDRDQDRLLEYKQELENLGVELKDWFMGLVDFPSWMEDHEVYLCWRLGEPEVGYWHDLDVGFAGRQTIQRQATNN
ncbi:MAG TPA: DUF2203 domain-containing protein [Gemmataceae bacterium]|nr:DUF2203 domain-containing protein [Gemmataceae bacterium]